MLILAKKWNIIKLNIYIYIYIYMQKWMQKL